jgi:voltage-gated potassium channel
MLRAWMTKWSSARYLTPIVFSLLIFLAGAGGFYLLELPQENGEGFFDAMYWTVVTLTTVGYGDIAPKTMAGRGLAMLTMISGIGLVSVLTGTLSSFLVERRANKRLGLLHVNVTGHVVVLGWNSNGLTLIRSLAASQELGEAAFVAVNSLEPDQWEEVSFQLGLGSKLSFVRGNPALESVVAKAAPTQAKLAYILCQDGLGQDAADQQSLYAALTFKTLAPKVPLYAEVGKAANRDHLLKAGVSEVVSRGDLASRVLAAIGAHPGLIDFLQAIMGGAAAGHEDQGRRLAHRPLSDQEKKMSWPALAAQALAADGSLVLAVYALAKDLTLQDLLSEGSALDTFILELFAAAGQNTSVGEGGSRVVVNPGGKTDLSGFDGVLYLRPAVEAG